MSEWRDKNPNFPPYCFDQEGCFYANDKNERAKLLEHMHEIVSSLNDEGAYEWWICTVPDGADEDDFDYIADDVELCSEICELFGKIIHEYVFKEYKNKKEDK